MVSAAHLTVERRWRGDGLDERDVGGRWHKYLLRTVAAADGDRTLSTPLTRYYAEAGTPPGQWLGSGVAALGKGQLTDEEGKG